MKKLLHKLMGYFAEPSQDSDPPNESEMPINEEFENLEKNLTSIGTNLAEFDYNILISFNQELQGTVLMFVERDIDQLTKASTIAYLIYVLEQGLLRRRFMECIEADEDSELADLVNEELESLKRSQNYLQPLIPAQEVLKS